MMFKRRITLFAYFFKDQGAFMEYLYDIWSFIIESTSNEINYFDIIGVVGFGFYIINYSMVTFQKINSHGIAFFSINIVAATCVLTSLSQNFNLAAALIQVFWIGLGLVAIGLRLKSRLPAFEAAEESV